MNETFGWANETVQWVKTEPVETFTSAEIALISILGIVLLLTLGIALVGGIGASLIEEGKKLAKEKIVDKSKTDPLLTPPYIESSALFQSIQDLKERSEDKPETEVKEVPKEKDLPAPGGLRDQRVKKKRFW